MLGRAEVFRLRPGLPKRLRLRSQSLILSPKGLIADAGRLFVGYRLHDTLGVRVDGGTAIATLLRAPGHRAPDATDNGSRIANLLFNR